MATYDLDLVYCTQADVFAVGRMEWTATTRPTDEEVYGFARAAKGLVHQATRRAGSDFAPPASAIADDSTAQQLVHANAVGAAYFAWRAGSTVGDPRAIAMRDQLREDWIQLVGGMNSAGHQVRGTIQDTLEAVNGVLVMHSDLTDGVTQFPDYQTPETLSRRFTTQDVD